MTNFKVSLISLVALTAFAGDSVPVPAQDLEPMNRFLAETLVPEGAEVKLVAAELTDDVLSSLTVDVKYAAEGDSGATSGSGAVVIRKEGDELLLTTNYSMVATVPQAGDFQKRLEEVRNFSNKLADKINQMGFYSVYIEQKVEADTARMSIMMTPVVNAKAPISIKRMKIDATFSGLSALEGRLAVTVSGSFDHNSPLVANARSSLTAVFMRLKKVCDDNDPLCNEPTDEELQGIMDVVEQIMPLFED